MEEKYYLRIENNNFGFVIEGMKEIKEGDIKITNEDYDKFFELQGQGKQFRLKKEKEEVKTNSLLHNIHILNAVKVIPRERI